MPLEISSILHRAQIVCATPADGCSFAATESLRSGALSQRVKTKYRQLFQGVRQAFNTPISYLPQWERVKANKGSPGVASASIPLEEGLGGRWISVCQAGLVTHRNDGMAWGCCRSVWPGWTDRRSLCLARCNPRYGAWARFGTGALKHEVPGRVLSSCVQFLL